MKRTAIILLLAALVCSSHVNAQDEEPEVVYEADPIPMDTFIYDFQSLQEVARYIGGDDSLNRFVRSQLQVQKVTNYTAKLMFSIVVNKDSSIQDIKLVMNGTDLDPYAKSAVIQALMLTSRQWIPGQRNGQFVRSRRVIELDITWK